MIKKKTIQKRRRTGKKLLLSCKLYVNFYNKRIVCLTTYINIKYSKRISDKIIERLEEPHNSLVENKMPGAEAKQNKDKAWMCNYCTWKEECEGR